MGPRPDGRGRRPSCRPPLGVSSPSMGPRPDGRGRALSASMSTGAASLQWGRGRMAAEGAARPPRGPIGPAFNGAAAGWPRKAMDCASPAAPRGLQWGRGRMAAEGRLFCHCGGGRRQCLQWGRGRMAAEGRTRGDLSRCTRTFNGAAAGWPRKVGRRDSDRAEQPPSMGPRPDGRGRIVAVVEPQGAAAFNGAAAGWPRKASSLVR